MGRDHDSLAGRPSGRTHYNSTSNTSSRSHYANGASSSRTRQASSPHARTAASRTHVGVSSRNGTASSHTRTSSRTGAPVKDNPQSEKPKRKKGRYIPALDGLRAIAVLGVIAYHMGLNWAPGGLLGVTVFFVLSGYLITGLLLIEWDSTNTSTCRNSGYDACGACFPPSPSSSSA